MGWLIEPGTEGKMMVHEKDTILHDMSYELLMMEFENVNVPRTKEEFRKFARKAFTERVNWAMECFDYCAEEMLRKMFPENYPKMYNGKIVSTSETLKTIHVGDYVNDDVVMDFINSVPPKLWCEKFVQVGEPVDCKYDHEKGVWRETYMTFAKIAEDVWECRGNCFENEYKMRGF